MNASMETLVQLAKSGDQEAITQLYEQTYNSVYQSVRALIKDEDEALDIVQDSYIKGFQNLDKLEDPEKFQAWMKVIAANHARDFLRKNRPALFSERVNEDGEEIDLRHQDECPEHMPEEVIDRQETSRLINDILGTLSEEQRLAIVMFYYEERSIREIAASLSCSENTVKSRLNYGRKKVEAAVKALEKQGTKLYSLAPMPFLIWLLRLAKAQGIAAEAIAPTAAAGIVGAAATTGETAAASAAGSAAAGTATKAAGTAAGKALATKIVAGTLAVSLTAGAGVAVANGIHNKKENEAAHIVYEEVLDKCRSYYDLGYTGMMSDEERFWTELAESALAKYPQDRENALARSPAEEDEFPIDRALDYPSVGSTEFEEGIPMPQTAFDPIMRLNPYDYAHTYQENNEFRTDFDVSLWYAYYDLDKNGIDELVIKLTDDLGITEDSMQVLGILNGQLWCGNINVYETEDGPAWHISQTTAMTIPTVNLGYRCNYYLHIRFCFDSWIDEDNPVKRHEILKNLYPDSPLAFQYLCG